MKDGAALAKPRAYALIPYAHVADLARSIAFYALLGFDLEDTHKAGETVVWASLRNAGSRIFLILADARIDASAQAILFYLWTADIAALRKHLVDNDVRVGAVTSPPYMPRGEIRLVDPDGYVLLIGQPENER